MCTDKLGWIYLIFWFRSELFGYSPLGGAVINYVNSMASENFKALLNIRIMALSNRILKKYNCFYHYTPKCTDNLSQQYYCVIIYIHNIYGSDFIVL